MIFSVQLVFIGLLYVLVFGLMAFLFFCADDEAPGFKGQLARFMTISIPWHSKRLVILLCGKGIWRVCFDTYDYVANQRNPIMQAVYLFVINGAFISWLLFVVPQLPMLYISTVHIYGAYIGVILAQITFYLACSVSPGVITTNNAACFGHQPYDGLMYASGMFCKTCRVPKVLHALIFATNTTRSNLIASWIDGPIKALHTLWLLRTTFRPPLHLVHHSLCSCSHVAIL
jgi:hypothetical protein